MKVSKKLLGVLVVFAVVAIAGAVGASTGAISIGGSGDGETASLSCPGGMTRLGHEVNEQMSIFPFDPAFESDIVYTVADDFFRVEILDLGTHAGTHLDVPAHFIEGGRSVEELSADEFVWPAYKIVVDDLGLTGDFVEVSDIEAYEAANGQIPEGALVILQTGAEEFFGLGGDGDVRDIASKKELKDAGFSKSFRKKWEDQLANNTDDLFEFNNAGFSFDAVDWLFNSKHIAGVGSDAYGPDAASDENFDATFATLDNDGVALVAIANLDSVNVTGDIIMAPTVALTDGSGFSTDPIACHGIPDDDEIDD